MGEWSTVEMEWEDEWEGEREGEWELEDDSPLSSLVDMLLEEAELFEDVIVKDFLLFLFCLQTLLYTGIDLLFD